MPQILTKLSERLKAKRSRHSPSNVTHTMDQILWDYCQLVAEKLPRLPKQKLSEEEIAIAALRSLEEFGHVVREVDVDGSLTWRATPKMLKHFSGDAGGIVTIRAPAPIERK